MRVAATQDSTSEWRELGAQVTVEGKNDAHPLAIIATDLEPIRAPADVGPINGDATVMAPFNPGTGMAL
jgi:hypothetical protein